MNYYQKLKALCKKPFIENVAFSQLLFDDKVAYVSEGFGAQPIELWPVYSFFKQYLGGEKEEARASYQNWYREQLAKHGERDKREGGMKGGSLQQSIERIGTEERGIAARVEERFAFLESVKRQGYTPSKDQIHGIRHRGKVYLKNGHHRAAALKLLGYTEVPGVVVYPGWLGRLLGY